MEIQSELETINSFARKMNISVPFETIKGKVEEELVNIQRSAAINGFRPGKAPMSLIRSKFEDSAKTKTLEKIVSESYYEGLRSKGIYPISDPVFNMIDFKEGEALKYTAEFQVYPEVAATEYKGFELTQKNVEVTDEEIENQLKYIQRQFTKVEPITGKTTPEKGDYISFSYEGSANNEIIKEASAPSAMLELGKEGLPIPAFNDILSTMTVGETKMDTITIPETFQNKALVGKAIDFKITLNGINKLVVPELDDNLAKEIGETSMAELRTKITSGVSENKNEENRENLKRQIIEKLIAKNPLETPTAMITEEKNFLRETTTNRLKGQYGYDPAKVEEYLGKWDGDLTARAEMNTKSVMLFRAIAEKENIDVEQTEIDAKIKELATRANMPVEKVEKFYADQSKRTELKYRIFEDKVVDFIIANSTVTTLKSE